MVKIFLKELVWIVGIMGATVFFTLVIQSYVPQWVMWMILIAGILFWAFINAVTEYDKRNKKGNYWLLQLYKPGLHCCIKNYLIKVNTGKIELDDEFFCHILQEGWMLISKTPLDKETYERANEIMNEYKSKQEKV